MPAIELPPGIKVLIVLAPDMAKQEAAMKRHCAEWLRLTPGTFEVVVAEKETEHAA